MDRWFPLEQSAEGGPYERVSDVEGEIFDGDYFPGGYLMAENAGAIVFIGSPMVVAISDYGLSCKHCCIERDKHRDLRLGVL